MPIHFRPVSQKNFSPYARVAVVANDKFALVRLRRYERGVYKGRDLLQKLTGCPFSAVGCRRSTRRNEFGPVSVS